LAVLSTDQMLHQERQVEAGSVWLLGALGMMTLTVFCPAVALQEHRLADVGGR